MIETLNLGSARRDSRTDDIVRQLVSLILDEGLRPGNKLPSERKLMARLSVGRSTLREAVKTLAALGIVEVQVGSGMFVANGNASMVTRPLSWGLLMGERSTREVIEARRVVEIELAGFAAGRASPAEMATIEEKLTLMRASLENADAFARYDVEFHLAIGRAAHSQVLYHVVVTLQHVLRVWFVEVFPYRTDPTEPIRKHEPIVAAIRAKDPNGARHAMAEHLDIGAKWLLEVLHDHCSDGSEPPN